MEYTISDKAKKVTLGCSVIGVIMVIVGFFQQKDYIYAEYVDEHALSIHYNGDADKEQQKELQDLICSKVYKDNLYEISSLSLDGSVKTYDYVKEKITLLKDLLEKSKGKTSDEVKELKTKIKELESNKNNSEFWSKTHEEAVKKWEEDSLLICDVLKIDSAEFKSYSILKESLTREEYLKIEKDVFKLIKGKLIKVKVISGYEIEFHDASHGGHHDDHAEHAEGDEKSHGDSHSSDSEHINEHESSTNHDNHLRGTY